MPTLYIIAGPNGVGKTTFADEYLPDEIKQSEFINADLIARGLSPYDPEAVAIEAGKNEFSDPRLLAVEKFGRLIVRDRTRFAGIQKEAEFEI